MFVKQGHDGDTIVEVLIAIAVAGFVLAAAFVSAGTSLKQIFTAQERGRAQKIAQATIERLDTAVSKSTVLSGAGAVGTFCINASSQYVSNPASADCKTEDLYTTSVTRTSTEPITYTVKVEWDGLSGTKQRVLVDYRIGRPKL